MVRVMPVAVAGFVVRATPPRVAIDGHVLPDLRGSAFSQIAVHGPAPGPAPAPGVAPPTGPTLGLCNCPMVPEDQCSCGASLSFLQCVHTQCSAGECECPKGAFESECSALSRSCSSELDFDGCHSLHTSCEGRFHQAADGVVGLTLDTSSLWEEAFCGPHGRCTGDIQVRANAYRSASGSWLACEIPTGEDDKVYHCNNAVTDQGASGCTLTMPSYIAPSAAVTGYCFLTAGKLGRKITKEAFFVVRNRYTAAEAAVAATVAAPPKAVTATKKKVVLERDDEGSAKVAEVKEEQVEEEIAEEGVEHAEKKKDTTKKANDGNFFEKWDGGLIEEGTGVASKGFEMGSSSWWIPLALVVLLVGIVVALIALKKGGGEPS